jgi:hypothetical protein
VRGYSLDMATTEQQQMAFESEFCCGVLGRGQEFLLVDLNGPIQDFMEAAREKNYAYCGVLGVERGEAGVRCEPGADAAFTMLHASLAFAKLAAARLMPTPKGDGVEWLDALYRLPDTRSFAARIERSGSFALAAPVRWNVGAAAQGEMDAASCSTDKNQPETKRSGPCGGLRHFDANGPRVGCDATENRGAQNHTEQQNEIA